MKNYKFNKNKISLLESLQEEKIALLNKIIENSEIYSDDIKLDNDENEKKIE